MKVNVVIVDADENRGVRAGRYMAEGLRKDVLGFEMHVHVRHPDDKTGVDTAYARYTG